MQCKDKFRNLCLTIIQGRPERGLTLPWQLKDRVRSLIDQENIKVRCAGVRACLCAASRSHAWRVRVCARSAARRSSRRGRCRMLHELMQLAAPCAHAHAHAVCTRAMQLATHYCMYYPLPPTPLQGTFMAGMQ